MQTTGTATQLVGREAEIAAVRGALEAASAGTVQACLLTGPPGAGKTTVWRASVELARQTGFTVLSSSPAAQEAVLGYSVLVDLLGGLAAERLDRLPAPQRNSVRAALQLETDGGPVTDVAAAAGVRSILDELAREGPVCVAIDDVQWMDRSSRRVLSFALRRLDGVPLIVLAARRQATGAAPRLEDDAVPGPAPHVVHLGPMSVAALHHVLREVLGTTFPRPTLVKITTWSNGNPLLAIELARSILAAGGRIAPDGRAPLASPSVRRLLGRRIAGLSDDQRRTLLVAALAGDGSIEKARRVHATLGWRFARPDPGTGLIELADATITFRHPLYVEAVVSAAHRDETAAVHRAIAQHADRADVRARHLAEGSSEVSEEIAVAMDDAVDQALAAGAIDAAVDLSGFALDRSPIDSPHRDGRLRRHVALLYRAGDSQRARELLDQALAVTASPAKRVPLLLLLATAGTASHGATAIQPLAHEVIRLAGDDRVAVARAELILAEVADSAQEGLRHVQRALRIAGDAGPRDLRSQALSTAAMLRSQAGRRVAMGAMDDAVTLEADRYPGRLVDSARFTRGWLLLMGDELDQAREDFEMVCRRAEDTGDEAALPAILAQLGHLEIRAGNWTRAEAHSQSMLQAAERSGQRFWSGLAHTQLGSVAGLSGDNAGAVHHLRAAARLAGELDDPFLRSVTLQAQAQLAFANGRHAEAAELFAAGRAALAGVIGDPGMTPWLGLEVEAAARAGRLADARALADELEPRAQRQRRRRVLGVVARGRAVIAASEADLDAADRHARASVRTLAALPDPFEHARSLFVLGTIQRRRREKRAADTTLARAGATFVALGAASWARQAAAERMRIGLRPRASGELTAGESLVARLAAEGRSNREIAERAFLGLKTVEATLARVYGKLGISRRAELGTRLAAIGIELGEHDSN